MHHGNEENKALMLIRPSFIIRLSNSGSQAGWSLSQLSYAERRVTPWTGCTGQTQRETQLIMFSITPTANLDSPVNLTWMSLGCREGVGESRESPHSHRWNMQKPINPRPVRSQR